MEQTARCRPARADDAEAVLALVRRTVADIPGGSVGVGCSRLKTDSCGKGTYRVSAKPAPRLKLCCKEWRNEGYVPLGAIHCKNNTPGEG
ncbi:MAG: hypothetical protein J1D88_05955 [Treponema sp.]|nr:hypothetical protein [Treponema sp.]